MDAFYNMDLDQQNSKKYSGDTTPKHIKPTGLKDHQEYNVTVPLILTIIISISVLVSIVGLLIALKFLAFSSLYTEPSFDKIKPTIKKAKLDKLNPDNFYFPDVMQPRVFVGREDDLQLLIHQIINKKTSVVNIVGPLGYGKTTLSIELGKYLQDHYRYAVAYANLKHIRSIPSALDAIMSSLGVHQGSQMIELRDINIRSNKVLLILDDIDYVINSHDIEFINLLETIIKLHKISFVTTSKQKCDFTSHFYTYNIPLMSQKSSVELLQHVHTNIIPEHAYYIADITQGLPILLDIIGHQLHSQLYLVTELRSYLLVTTRQIGPIDPTIPSTIFQFLRTILDNKCNLTQNLVSFALEIDDDGHDSKSKNDSLLELVDSGLLKFHFESANYVEFHMQDFVRDFAGYLCENENNLSLCQKLLPMEPLLVVVGLGLMVNIMGRIIIRIKNKSMMNIVFIKRIYILSAVFVSIVILECIYTHVTHKPRNLSLSVSNPGVILSCLIGGILVISTPKPIWKIQIQESILQWMLLICLHLLFSSLVLAVVYYTTYFILLYLVSSQDMEKAQGCYALFHPVQKHFIFCCQLELMTLFTPLAIYVCISKQRSEKCHQFAHIDVPGLVQFVTNCFLLAIIIFIPDLFESIHIQIFLNSNDAIPFAASTFNLYPIHIFIFLVSVMYVRPKLMLSIVLVSVWYWNLSVFGFFQTEQSI
ncbi:uncharacterized protein [Amphiura filiformis]|uniref:uncharacterized protein n=1 Tax=Amphiura filiformis TaxID=82378 RepID=UPI003B20F38E